MFCSTHKDRHSGIPNLLRTVATGWHKRSCAVFLGATTLMSLSLSGPATTPAASTTPPRNQTSSSSWATTSALCSRGSTIKD